MRAGVSCARLLAMLLLLVGGCASSPASVPGADLRVQRLGLIDDVVNETSGLAEYGGYVWTHNDSGGGARVYALDPDTASLRATYTLQDALNIDWEELAQDDRHLHVLDCGDNLGYRRWRQVYSVGWQDLDAAGGTSVPSMLTEFRFADARPTQGAYKHDNDCEAAAMVEGRLWIFSKNWIDQATRLYRVSLDGGRHALIAEAEFAVGGQITAADYDPVRAELALLGYIRKRFSSSAFLWRIPVSDGEPQWSDARRQSILSVGQWEAIRWRSNGVLLTRESSLLGSSELGFIPLP
ncbi:hypothetical protein [Marinobacterium weihaiense]|uniref:Esterase-like activity of phytase n=1 Tax=Marinobacterium weihaiense TaxID=2851016 RepID=A0ABS6M8J3_9GAMM|nr:hypothetical protein [Marinobacterium weihaiense]MBV0932102.1 hypothetical protein [Marinobacterium weihaiense]